MTLTEWAQTAAPGSRLIYGRDDGTHRPAACVMREARDLREAGLLHTLLRREKTGSLAYIAQRTGGRACGESDGGFPSDDRNPAQVRQDRILALMAENMSNAEIAEVIGSTQQCVAQAIHAMRKRGGRHVPEREWRANGRCLVSGCGRCLSRRNESKVCAEHRHDREHCHCEMCVRRRGE